MPLHSVELPRSLVNQILQHTLASPEREVCGLIGAKEETPYRWYAVANVATAPQVRFQMEPAGLVDALRQIRDNGETLFAIVHSHPHAPAEPSAIDLAEAAYPEALYLVISLDTKGVLEMRAFRLDGDRPFKEVELLLRQD